MAVKKAAAKKAAPKKAAPPAPKKVVAPKSNVVVVDFSEDSKELLRGLIGAITSSFAPVVVNAAAPGATKQVFQADIAAPIKAATPAPAATPPPPTANTLLTSIREMINTKAGEGKTAEIVALLSKYGAQSASTLEAEHFQGFFDDLKNV